MANTHPRHILDETLWPILQATWEKVSIKKAHFWHWRDYPHEVETSAVVPPDPKAGDRSKGIIYNLIFTNFGWKNVYVLEPEDFSGEYQIGFQAEEGQEVRQQFCSVILNGPTGVLQGPYTTKFFALDLEGNIIRLREVKRTTKKRLDESITLI